MIVDKIFETHMLTRQKFVGFLDKLAPEQLAVIPNGFRNNIWWNIVHAIVTQQLLCYHMSGNDVVIDSNWVEKFKKGTTPEPNNIPKSEEIEEIKKLLISTSEQLKADYEQGKFTGYNIYPTSYGFTLSSIDDAILFNNMHETMHLGTVIALNKLV